MKFLRRFLFCFLRFQLFRSNLLLLINCIKCNENCSLLLFCMRIFSEEVREFVRWRLVKHKDHLGIETMKGNQDSLTEKTSPLHLVASSPPLPWLVSPRWCGSHPDGAAPLQRGAAAGEGHAHVPGHQGLPLRLEAGLEGGRQQQQQLGGEQEPRGPGEGRPLQLEQHPEPPCRPVEEGGLCDLWGHPGLPASALRDTEERPVFPALTWLTGAPSGPDTQASASNTWCSSFHPVFHHVLHFANWIHMLIFVSLRICLVLNCKINHLFVQYLLSFNVPDSWTNSI